MPTANYKISHHSTKPDFTKDDDDDDDDENLGYESLGDPKFVYSQPHDFPGYSTRIYTSENAQTSPSNQPYVAPDPPPPKYINA